MKRSYRIFIIAIVLIAIAGSIYWITTNFRPEVSDITDYSNMDNWAIYEEGKGRADLFFICPTVDLGVDGNMNMALDDEVTKASFLGASKMELGIYDEDAVVYVPYYRQVTFPVYQMDEETADEYFEIAYSDVKAAFEYYLEKADPDRPLILAGFSQGSQMLIWLMEDYFDDEALSNRLVAAYAIGWRLTKEEVEKYGHLVPATGESDTGVIVMFNSESEDITGSLLVPEGTWTYSINPLNWKTDSTAASLNENKGACFTDYDGNVLNYIEHLTGAYIDPERGTLKCTDIVATDYSNILFEDGVYHLFDYQFFYNDLKSNVSVRLNAWFEK